MATFAKRLRTILTTPIPLRGCLIAVSLLLTILAGFLWSSLNSFLRAGDPLSTRNTLDVFGACAQWHVVLYGHFPNTQAELVEGFERDQRGESPKHAPDCPNAQKSFWGDGTNAIPHSARHSTSESFKDAWGNPLAYRLHLGVPELRSAGEDEELYTPDDIVLIVTNRVPERPSPSRTR